jgi:opacity protein-like surface antigen
MRNLLLGVAAAALASLAAAPASAAAVQFTGTTQGCFGTGCTPVTGTLLSPVTDNGLSYISGGFNQTSDSTGFLGVGGSSDNLGVFNLGVSQHTYTGDVFDLLVNFTNPGTGNSLYQAMLQGTVTSLTNGSVFINFDNTPQLITASNGAQFTLQVNDVSITPGIAQILSGQLQAVPEPSTWAMMLLGFGAIGLATRRRRRPVLAQIA